MKNSLRVRLFALRFKLLPDLKQLSLLFSVCRNSGWRQLLAIDFK